jgi:hypothetical protein
MACIRWGGTLQAWSTEADATDRNEKIRNGDMKYECKVKILETILIILIVLKKGCCEIVRWLF